RAKVVQAGVQLGAPTDCAGADILVDALATGSLERVELQGEVLGAGGDACVADQRLVFAHRGDILCCVITRAVVFAALLSAEASVAVSAALPSFRAPPVGAAAPTPSPGLRRDAPVLPPHHPVDHDQEHDQQRDY